MKVLYLCPTAAIDFM